MRYIKGGNPFRRSFSSFRLVLALAVILGLSGGAVVLSSAAVGPDGGIFRLAVDRETGKMRLLSPKITGDDDNDKDKDDDKGHKFSSEPKKKDL
jgi:predicted acylesterase/phospholipase RssA